MTHPTTTAGDAPPDTHGSPPSDPAVTWYGA